MHTDPSSELRNIELRICMGLGFRVLGFRVLGF